MSKRKHRIKWGNVLLVLVLFILLIKGIVTICSMLFAPREVTSPIEYETRLFMVGDALIHDAIYNDAKIGEGEYDFTSMLEFIKPISSKYDLAYYNQETILGGESLGYSSYPCFNSPQEVGDAFIDAGFNMVSLANNHTLDKGEQGVIESLNYWKRQQNVIFTGQFSSFEDRDMIRTFERNGIKYAFFSYTTYTNDIIPPKGKEYLVNTYSYKKAKKDIEKVRNDVDFVIVAMHWGEEYTTGVVEEQEKIANELSKLGVDLIIGSHPHVVEPVEYINDGRTFVIYSLGNFISSQVGIDRLTGLMMDITFKKTVFSDGNVELSMENPHADLIYTSYKDFKNFKVFPYYELSDNILAGHLSYYNNYKEIVSSRYSELEWGITGE